MKAQLEFNVSVMTHFHNSPLFGAPTLPSIVTAGPSGIKCSVDYFSRGILQSVFLKNNIASFKSKYLLQGGESYSNSKLNTCN